MGKMKKNMIRNDTYSPTFFCYDVPTLQLGSSIGARHIFVSDTLEYFIDTSQ